MCKKIRTLLLAAAIGCAMLTANAAIAAQKAEVSDLVGRDGIKAFDIMTSRGFESVDTYTTSDDYIVTWWYNAKTGQCVNTQSKDNKVTSAAEDKNPKCTAAAARAGSSGAGAGNSSTPSKQAKKACGSRFGGKHDISEVTPLKPGWWEIILTGHKGRKVACTVNNDGTIADWVEMN